MAVTWRASFKVQRTATGNEVATEPTGTVSGDAMVFIVAADSAATIGAPAGWTVPSGYSGNSGGMDFMAGYIQRGGSAPSLTWTFGAGSVYREVQIITLQGAATVAFDASSTAGTTGSSAHAPNASAVVAVAASSLAVVGGFDFAGYTSVVAPTGYVLRTDTANATYDAIMATKSLSASGSEDPAAFGGTWANGAWWDGFVMTFTDVSASQSVVPLLMRQYRTRKN